MTEPTPDFSTPPMTAIAGIRPFRTTGIRLDAQTLPTQPQKYLVHNYGHGACGVTLSWGCAMHVRRLVETRIAQTHDKSVAVLGSGVIGLTVATLLSDIGLKVTVYTKDRWQDTVSAVAAAQWAPTSAKFATPALYKTVVKDAYTRFKSDLTRGYGVSERPNYTPVPDKALDDVIDNIPGLIPKPVAMPLPFAGMHRNGYKYMTLLVETPIFLKRLHDDLVARNVVFKTGAAGTIKDMQAIRNLPDNLIVNCTGLGAKDMLPDPDMHPIKGHLALLKPQPQLDYLFSKDGYLFPRADAVIVGGTYLYDKGDPTPDPVESQRLVDYMKGVFGVTAPITIPDTHIHHPMNEVIPSS